MSTETLTRYPPSKEDSRAAYEAVVARAVGVCEGCGAGGDGTVHHRRPRNLDGWNTIENMIRLCDRCHMFAHAGHHPVALGWTLPATVIPARVPMFRKTDNTWHLIGRVLEPINANTAIETMHAHGLIRTGAGYAW